MRINQFEDDQKGKPKTFPRHAQIVETEYYKLNCMASIIFFIAKSEHFDRNWYATKQWNKNNARDYFNPRNNHHENVFRFY